MSYVSFRGVTTTALGVLVAKMPSHKKASVRYEEYEIPGRDGSVHTEMGYMPFDMQFTLTALDDTADIRQAINAWADGTGELFTSDDTGKVWTASVLQEVQFTRREYGGKFFDTALVTFHCQPIQHEKTRTVITLEESEEITNIGTVAALPKIVVYGEGTCSFSIAGQEVSLLNMQQGKPVTIESETGYAYTSDGAVEMIGEFPVIPLGTSDVILMDDTEKLVITPNWGWL